VASQIDPAPRCGPGDHCITCGDQATSMTVLRVDADRALALCAGDGDERRTVDVALLEPVAPGERVLVHADVALQRLEEAA
jgi:hydrogenase maturation factor